MPPEQLLASEAASKKAMSTSDAQALCRGIGALTALAGGGATFSSGSPRRRTRTLTAGAAGTRSLTATCSPDKHNVLIALQRQRRRRAATCRAPRRRGRCGSWCASRRSSTSAPWRSSARRPTATAPTSASQMPRISIWRRRVDDQRPELVRDERDVQLGRDAGRLCARPAAATARRGARAPTS
jgi:hypothetical protein